MSRQLVGRIASIAGVVVLVALLAVVGKAWWDSRIPGTYSVMSYGTHDYGGGVVTPNHEAHGVSGTSVADLRGPTEGAPDERFELTAQAADVHLSSGRIVHALTFNLPAVTSVQLLVDGKEVDTLAGHVDLRRPLSKNLQFAIEN